MQGREDPVQDPLSLKKRLPGQDPEQGIHPHRQDKEKGGKGAPSDLPASQNQSERKGREEANRRAHGGEKQCEAERPVILPDQNLRDISKRKAAASIGEAIEAHEKQRDYDKADHPDEIGQRQQFHPLTLQRRWPPHPPKPAYS